MKYSRPYMPYWTKKPIRIKPIDREITELNAYLSKLGISPIIPKKIIRPIQPIYLENIELDPYKILTHIPDVPSDLLLAAHKGKPFHASWSDGRGTNVNINSNRRQRPDKLTKARKKTRKPRLEDTDNNKLITQLMEDEH